MRAVEAFRTIARDKLQHTRLWRVCNRARARRDHTIKALQLTRNSFKM